jgi:hypothetical protein
MGNDPPKVPIQRGQLYALQNFQAATGLGRTSLREARRRGLRVQYVHGRAFVLGDDWLDYVSHHGRQSDADTPDDSK